MSSELPRRKKKKAAAAAEQPLTGPSSIHDVPDDLLQLILLRLDSSIWIARAASTCKRWHGIIAADDGGAAFLRLSRALHPPAIAGHYHLGRRTKDFVPTSPPPPIDGSRFSSLDFLPGYNNTTCHVADCYGGLVLLVNARNLIVCDPLARLWRQVPYSLRSWGDTATLIDGEADGGGISLSNFRILYIFYPGDEAHLFSTAEDGDWWPLEYTAPAVDLDSHNMAHVAGRVDGSLFLGLKSGRLMVLDKASLDFSAIDLPTSTDPSNPDNCSIFRVVHSSGAGLEPQTVRVVHVNGEDFEVFRQVNGGWTREHSIPRLSEVIRELPGYREKEDCDWTVEAVGDGAGFIVLSAQYWCQRSLVFSVDLETMKIAVVPYESYRAPTCSYRLPWPSFQGVRRSRRIRRRTKIDLLEFH